MERLQAFAQEQDGKADAIGRHQIHEQAGQGRAEFAHAELET